MNKQKVFYDTANSKSNKMEVWELILVAILTQTKWSKKLKIFTYFTFWK